MNVDGARVVGRHAVGQPPRIREPCARLGQHHQVAAARVVQFDLVQFIGTQHAFHAGQRRQDLARLGQCRGVDAVHVRDLVIAHREHATGVQVERIAAKLLARGQQPGRMQRLIGVHHLRGLLDAVVAAHDHARIALVAGLQQVGDHTIEFAQLLSHMCAVGSLALQHVVHVRQIAQCQRGIVPLHHALRGLRDPLGAADVGARPPEVEQGEVAKLGLQAIAQGAWRAEDVRVLAPVGGVLGSRRHRDVRAAEHVEPAEQVRHRHAGEALACGFPHHGALQQTVGLSPQTHFALVAVHPAVCNGAVVSRRLTGEQVALACAGDRRRAGS